MMRKLVSMLLAVCLIAGVMTGCGSKAPEAEKEPETVTETPATEETGKTEETEKPEATAEKKTFVIYNAAGAPGYHEQVVLKKFQEEFGDKYDIKYETMGGAEVVAKIEAQGFQKGDGNINIVMSGDSHAVMGLQSGVWADLSEENEALRLDDLNDLGVQIWEAFDHCGVPISTEPSQPAIAYMPDTEKGKIIDEVVGEDSALTYQELFDLLANNPEMKMGRGRFPGSGPGDVFTFGLMNEVDNYGADEIPQNSIDMFHDAYANGQVALYQGTSDTFKDLVAGNVDMVPHTLSWFFRLYALKLEEATLSEDLKVDSLGLENAKFAYIVDEAGKPVPANLTNHVYLVPANLSDEDYAASMEFLSWVTQPEMNANVLTVLCAPTYKPATPDLITDESVLMVWNAVQKYYPAAFLEETESGMKCIATSGRECVMPITDVGVTNTYKTAWQEQLESLAE